MSIRNVCFFIAVTLAVHVVLDFRDKKSTFAISDSQGLNVLGGQTILVDDPEEVDLFADHFPFTECDEIVDCETRTCQSLSDETACDGNFSTEAVNSGSDYGCITGTFDSSCYQWTEDSIGYDKCADFISYCEWAEVPLLGGGTTYTCVPNNTMPSGNPDIYAPEFCFTDVF